MTQIKISYNEYISDISNELMKNIIIAFGDVDIKCKKRRLKKWNKDYASFCVKIDECIESEDYLSRYLAVSYRFEYRLFWRDVKEYIYKRTGAGVVVTDELGTEDVMVFELKRKTQ